ncbi:MAG: hypothetical protein AAGM67_12690, partial [Bacteroidota bacterium]
MKEAFEAENPWEYMRSYHPSFERFRCSYPNPQDIPFKKSPHWKEDSDWDHQYDPMTGLWVFQCECYMSDMFFHFEYGVCDELCTKVTWFDIYKNKGSIHMDSQRGSLGNFLRSQGYKLTVDWCPHWDLYP